MTSKILHVFYCKKKDAQLLPDKALCIDCEKLQFYMAIEATLAAKIQCEMPVYFVPRDIFKQYDCETGILHLTTLLSGRIAPMYRDIKVHCIEGVDFF